MSSGSEPIRVVAAVIEREGKYLITQRQASAVLGGMWEFPGGKVEPGESDEAALKRELQERVGVDVEVKDQMARRRHDYDGYSVELALYHAKILSDHAPQALRVAACSWVASSEFEKYPFPAADQATMDQLLGVKR
jgi:8-oxo-dGTP diphosphatase